MPPSITGNSLGWLDYLVIALYLGVNVGIGWWVQRQKRNTGADYFLGGGRVPPWASAISWYGTAVSSVSFMALPAYAYSKDWLRRWHHRRLRLPRHHPSTQGTHHLRLSRGPL
jgi:hypothetical protein